MFVTLELKQEEIDSVTSFISCSRKDGKVLQGRPRGLPFDRRIVAQENFFTSSTKVIHLIVKKVKQKVTEYIKLLMKVACLKGTETCAILHAYWHSPMCSRNRHSNTLCSNNIT